MKRKAVVLLLGGEEGAGFGAAAGAFFQPLLGRPLGAFALEAVCGIDPEAVLVLAGAGPAVRAGWENLIKGVETKTPVSCSPGKGGRRDGARASSRPSSRPGPSSKSTRTGTSWLSRPVCPFSDRKR